MQWQGMSMVPCAKGLMCFTACKVCCGVTALAPRPSCTSFRATGKGAYLCVIVSPVYTLQIEMGSTNIRVGSTIFGARQYPAKAAPATASAAPASPTSSASSG